MILQQKFSILSPVCFPVVPIFGTGSWGVWVCWGGGGVVKRFC